MGSTFNPQILVEKLAKLNNSQTSIETLSHWCIFHMNKARQVVETWDRQFHCSPRDQRLAFLYLANDILQNSRRKGSEFVGEFWKVLPDALRDLMDNGDDFGRSAAQRLVNIWDERKVFGSRGQILKEELVGRHTENNNRNGNGKQMNTKLKHSVGNTVDKLVSGYQVLYGQMDEDAVLSKCRNAINFVEKVEKEIGGDINPGQFHGTPIVEELQGQHSILRDCVQQLTAVQSSRSNLVSLLREALQEQEIKLDQVRNQLQAAQSHSEQANNIFRQLVGRDNVHSLGDRGPKEVHTSVAPHTFMGGDKEQSAPVMYAPTASFAEKSGHMEEDPRKSAAAAVAAKLTASTSSAQMLSYVLSSLASEGVIGSTMKDSSSDYSSEKRPKLENDQSAYVPSSQNTQPLQVPAFPRPESLTHNVTTTNQQFNPNDAPPPPSSSPPPLPPLPPLQQYPVPPFMQTAGSIGNVPQFSYSMTQQAPPTMPGYPNVGGAPLNGVSPYATTSSNSYQGFQGPDGNFYNQASSMPMAPISRQ
ncbi:uncharacterized protein LOC133817025 [Humulus lupulus]|uniref:uncharacterized protein LOC133817025 n=1 Tax=Humulus lupulus TaxID=3486 RepID=UPI002B404AB0|nr:uncharacterized protein LOC133817025 [Humulus lupulus]